MRASRAGGSNFTKKNCNKSINGHEPTTDHEQTVAWRVTITAARRMTATRLDSLRCSLILN